MEQGYILAIDQGTTSSRAIVFDRNGEIKEIAQKEFRQIFPKSGWVEHDPEDIWNSQLEVLNDAIGKLPQKDLIKGIGITNQRETTLLWNRETGEPVYNAIVWQDRRTADYCNEIAEQGFDKTIQEKTGLIIDAYFSASKIHWILENVDGARELAEKGQLAFGTVDSWLIWKLTEGKVHITDVSNASRTMLYNIHDLTWDKELLEIFDIPASLLPEVKSNSEVYAETSPAIIGSAIPIAGIAGDQQAALFGQLCLDQGMVKNTYGTGCFILMNIGEKPIISKNKLVTTIAWKIGDEVNYALEGSVFIAGAVIQWLRDEMKLIQAAPETEEISQSIKDTDGVYFVPAFAGLGAPHWNPKARGTLLGLSRGTKPAHIIRAALESIAFQSRDVILAMEHDSGSKIKELRVDGGAALNNFLMQFQADLLKADVLRPKVTETTALGAAYLAGLAVGFWKDTHELQQQWQVDKKFVRDSKKELDNHISNWNKAVKTVNFWTK
ncbi:MAG TPA: glycerol kinase GlpK [Sphingobacterium sp.]|nr:glycerol kinase GlpK [Sphingobacterium sp.]